MYEAHRIRRDPKTYPCHAKRTIPTATESVCNTIGENCLFSPNETLPGIYNARKAATANPMTEKKM